MSESRKTTVPEIMTGGRNLEPEDQGWYKSKILGIKKFAYVSPSQVKVADKSMRAYYRNYVLGYKPKDTPSKILGRLIHKALLEPEDFRRRYVVERKFTGTGSRAAKTDWLNEQDGDALILTQENADKILFMIESVQENRDAADILEGSAREVHTYVRHDRLNLWYYGIIDILKNSIVADLKSTTCSQKDTFLKQAAELGYHIQSAMYLDMGNIVTGKKLTHFPIIAIENQEPYTTTVIRMPDSMIEAGRIIAETRARQIQDHVKRYSENPKSVVWAGYDGETGIVEPVPPSWMMAKFEAIQEAHTGE